MKKKGKPSIAEMLKNFQPVEDLDDGMYEPKDEHEDEDEESEEEGVCVCVCVLAYTVYET